MDNTVETLSKLRTKLQIVKKAFQPATGAGMAPPQDPAAMQQQGMPPQGDPAMAQQQVPVGPDGQPIPVDPSTGQPMPAGPPPGEIEQVIYDLSQGLDQLAQAFEGLQQQVAKMSQENQEMQSVMTDMAEGLQIVKQNLMEE